MLSFLKNIFGPGPDYKKLIDAGAVILDVRTPGEYNGGHIKGSINIPLTSLPHHLSKLSKNKAIITCCASGMRSASAKNLLQSNGFTEVYNGGSWVSVNKSL